MFCDQCGSQINENTNFCSNCGKPIKSTGTFQSLEADQENAKEWVARVRPAVTMIYCVDNVDAVYKALEGHSGKGVVIKNWDNGDQEDISKIHSKTKKTQNSYNTYYPYYQGTDSSKPFIRCFGNFEIFQKGSPIKFHSQKTKEMVAYLVDRCGARCTNAEIVATLWEDDKDHTSYLKKIKKDLRETLLKYGISDMITFARGNVHLNIYNVACDYYDWKNGLLTNEKLINGEYMEQYSWAETTKGEILSVCNAEFSGL